MKRLTTKRKRQQSHHDPLHVGIKPAKKTSHINMSKQLSKLQISLFVMIFASLGIYLLVASHADPLVTYYVSPAGIDTNAGTSPAAAFATIGHALRVSTGGETIYVASGTYPAIVDAGARASSTVTVIGQGATKPIISGVQHGSVYASIYDQGVANVTFQNFKLIAPAVIVGGNNIVLDNLDITYGDGLCVGINRASHNVTLQNSHIHDCASGLGGSPSSPPAGSPAGTVVNASDHINILNNVFDHFSNDAIQFGDWDYATFDHNTMSNAYDPSHINHDDLLQFTGGSHHTVITNNIMHDSEDQLMLIQPHHAPIDDLLMQNNLLYNSDAIAVQSFGVTNARFIGNTIWHGGLGGLLLRAAEGGQAAHDTIVANNILSGYSKTRDAAGVPAASTAYEDYNYIAGTQVTALGAHDKVGGDPGFVDIDNNNYHLLANSGAIDAADSTYGAVTDLANLPRIDVPNVANSGIGPSPFHDMGAYEYQVGSNQTPGPPDHTPPTVTIDRGPPSSTISTSAGFKYISNEPVTHQICSIDGKLIRGSCGGVTDLALGPHTYAIQAVDWAGNTTTVPTTYSWTVVTPTSTLDTGLSWAPVDPTPHPTVAFGPSSNLAGATYQCSLDGAVFVVCPIGVLPIVYSHLSPGSHTLAVRAVNPTTGEVDPTPVTHTWTITDGSTPPPPPDTTAPTVPTGLTATAASFSVVNITWTASTDNVAVIGYHIYRNGAATPLAAVIGSTNFSDTTASGSTTYSYTVSAFDTANESAKTAGKSVTTPVAPDTTPPTTAITAPAAAATLVGSTNVTASASDAVGVTKVELYIDGQLAATDVAAPFAFSWNTTTYSNGSHSLATKAYDAAGNVSTSSAVGVTINNPAPPIKPGDVDGNGHVDIFDLRILGKNWNLSNRTPAQGDLDGNGTVNVFDLRILGKNWGS